MTVFTFILLLLFIAFVVFVISRFVLRFEKIERLINELIIDESEETEDV